MAVKLRLRRMGKKKQPIYKVVAADSRAPRDGKFIEAIGTYHPKSNPAQVEIDEDRALYWLNVGAQPTDTVKNLLREKGITLRRELAKQGLSDEDIDKKMSEWYTAKGIVPQETVKKVEKAVDSDQNNVNNTEVKSDDNAEVKGTASAESGE